MFGNKLEKIDKLVAHQKAEALVALGNDKNKEVRLKAIDGMGKVGGDSCYNMLVSLLRDGEPAVRAAAATAMAQMGQARARGHIEHQMEQEKDASVQAAMRAALGKIHGDN